MLKKKLFGYDFVTLHHEENVFTVQKTNLVESPSSGLYHLIHWAQVAVPAHLIFIALLIIAGQNIQEVNSLFFVFIVQRDSLSEWTLLYNNLI